MKKFLIESFYVLLVLASITGGTILMMYFSPDYAFKFLATSSVSIAIYLVFGDWKDFWDALWLLGEHIFSAIKNK